jgi:hypothetical protein
MHKKKYVEFLEKKLQSINFENIKLKEQLGIANKPLSNYIPQGNQNVKILNQGNYPNNSNQIRPSNINFQNSINNINNKYVSNSPNINTNDAANISKTNMPQKENLTNNMGNSALNKMLAMQQINNQNLININNIKKIEQKRPDRSSNKNTGFQDKNVYMEHVKTDNLNASTAKNLRSSPQILIRNPNMNSNQKILIKNNLSIKNQNFQANNANNSNPSNVSNLPTNLKTNADEISNYEKSFYKQNLGKNKIKKFCKFL